MEERKCNNSSCTQESCAGCSKANDNNLDRYEKLNDKSKVNKVIAIMSGKGGVGKSLVTSSLAVELAKKGYKVGILDSDVTGPSIPKMFGLNGTVKGDEAGLYPEVTASGIKVISVNLLLEDKEEPVIWRGPVISTVVKQFWSDVYWGELDYLLIDMPPGTGDVPLTVFQSIPVDEVIIVTSPQDLVKLIVKKAYNMADKMDIHVLGMIENYSYLKCPDCDKVIEIFGTSKIDEISKELDIQVLGKLPIIPQYARLADEGKFDNVQNEYLESAIKAIIK